MTVTLSKNTEKGKTSASDQFLRNKFRTFKQGKQERTKQNRLLSGQRYNFVRCVYSMADLELSTCILCPKDFHSLHTPHVSQALCRAIFRCSEAASALREDAADVAGQFQEEDWDRELIKTYKYSLYYYAVQRWRAGELPFHGLLNFTSMKKRFGQADAQLEKNKAENMEGLQRAFAAKRRRYAVRATVESF